MTPSRRFRPHLLAVATLMLASSVLAACGTSPEGEHLNEGEPVQVGDLQYNLIFSRYLNAADTEDSAYLTGQPPVQPHGIYLGIFVQVKNTSSDAAAPLPVSFKISDTSGAEYESIPSESLYALPLGANVPAEADLPTEDSTAQTGPIEGSLILFQIPQTATENRPLDLVIPGAQEDAIIDLDL